MAAVKKKAGAAKKDSKYATADGHSYLTKRIMVSKARAAGKEAADDAMQVMGFVIVAEDNKVVRKNADGTVIVIAPIDNADPNNDIALD